MRAEPGLIYLAAPFFSLEQLWLVEETKVILEALGAKVFSPLHNVGFGRPQDVAPKDLEGLERSESVLAIMNGSDAGTVFEIGYAVAKNKKVNIYADRNLVSDLTMVTGTNCSVYADYCSAVYAAVWDACD
jgi:nucleoside 2-deoxyribosyltransferase